MTTDEPKRPLYSRGNLTPDTPLFREPPPTTSPDLSPEQIERRLAVLDRIGTRIIAYNDHYAVTTPVEPTIQLLQALADLKMDLPLLLVKLEGRLRIELFYELLPRGWGAVWARSGYRGVEQTIRNKITTLS